MSAETRSNQAPSNTEPQAAPAAAEPAAGSLQTGELAVQEILFATDLRPTSHTAGLYARALATRLDLPLTVMHVFLLNQGASEAEAATSRASAQRLDISAELAHAASLLSTPGSTAAALLCEGEPPREIVRAANQKPGCLLVLGTHAGSRVGRHLIGSTAELVLTSVQRPTVTVGPHVGDPSQEGLFRDVLFATDCSEFGSRAAPLACAFSRTFQGRLRVISVVDDTRGPVADTLATFDYSTREALTRAASPQACNFTESRTISRPGDARQVILSTLESTASDLLILGIEQHDSLGMLERDTNTFQIVARATKPVLTITSKAFR